MSDLFILYLRLVITYHSCDTSIHIQLCTIFCWLLFLKLCYCVACVLPLEKAVLISSVECPLCCLGLHVQWNLCIMDRLEAIHKCPDNQGVLIIHMIKHHLGPQLSMWIIQVSILSSVLINRFHCISL